MVRQAAEVNHTENKSLASELVPADQEPAFKNEISITVEGEERIIRSNDVPNHKIGKFPHAGNPDTMTEQEVEIKLPLHPTVSPQAIPARKAVGILLNGVYIESGTGEFWSGTGKSQPWNYEALGGALDFGLDEDYAHVQPGGKYHYHGKPTGLLQELSLSADKHSPLVGWAFDGFPIYAIYGYSDPEKVDSKIVEMTSSYRLKSGERPTLPDGPGGTYDGSFTVDYEYVEGLGTLDECNGCITKSPRISRRHLRLFYHESMARHLPKLPRNSCGRP